MCTPIWHALTYVAQENLGDKQGLAGIHVLLLTLVYLAFSHEPDHGWLH